MQNLVKLNIFSKNFRKFSIYKYFQFLLYPLNPENFPINALGIFVKIDWNFEIFDQSVDG